LLLAQAKSYTAVTRLFMVAGFEDIFCPGQVAVLSVTLFVRQLDPYFSNRSLLADFVDDDQYTCYQCAIAFRIHYSGFSFLTFGWDEEGLVVVYGWSGFRLAFPMDTHDRYCLHVYIDISGWLDGPVCG
jgi:hypothetical protein